MQLFNRELSTNSLNDIEQRIKRLEQRANNIKNDLSKFFVLGRLRTDRGAPTNSTDVTDLDLLYDLIVTEPYLYYLIDNSGSLEWRRITLNSF